MRHFRRRESAFLNKLAPWWYENITAERRKTVYDYWLELIRFARPGKEADFNAFLEKGISILKKIEGEADVHYVLCQLAQITWGEYDETNFAQKLADKILDEYPFIKWDKEKLIKAMDKETRDSIRMFRGVISSYPKVSIRTRGAPPEGEINRVIVCLAEHFREKSSGPRWKIIATLLNACNVYGVDYFDEHKIEKRYNYWKKIHKTPEPKQLYLYSLEIYDTYSNDLKGFLKVK